MGLRFFTAGPFNIFVGTTGPPRALASKRKSISCCQWGYYQLSEGALAEHVRIIGNDIAHPDAQHPARIDWDDIKAISEFSAQIVDAVYVAPYKAAELRKAHKRKGVPGA
jgi:hypothetical protein